jgi:hypothetical protein
VPLLTHPRMHSILVQLEMETQQAPARTCSVRRVANFMKVSGSVTEGDKKEASSLPSHGWQVVHCKK